MNQVGGLNSSAEASEQFALVKSKLLTKSDSRSDLPVCFSVRKEYPDTLLQGLS
ncbi:hypothetical protein JXA63_03125 [Candidatus Woesebacteria bacterium]|nr:hypothetical protein [Candidatus Woesebacteria bacterium]